MQILNYFFLSTFNFAFVKDADLKGFFNLFNITSQIAVDIMEGVCS